MSTDSSNDGGASPEQVIAVQWNTTVQEVHAAARRAQAFQRRVAAERPRPIYRGSGWWRKDVVAALAEAVAAGTLYDTDLKMCNDLLRERHLQRFARRYGGTLSRQELEWAYDRWLVQWLQAEDNTGNN
jgi:hypothetical protein